MKNKRNNKRKNKRSQGKFGTVIKRLKPLRDGDAGELRVQIIENHNVRRLDIRYFVKSENYTGYTQKGISLSAEEFGSSPALAG
jgi:hypothetical protein